MRTSLRNLNHWLDARSEKLQVDMVFALRQVHVLTLILRHPEAPWRAKGAAAFAALYILSPIQLIPTFIPVIGQMDDLLVVWLAMKVARKSTAESVITDCELRARLNPSTRTRESVGDFSSERPLPLAQFE
jgi:uncharacterized membrane protein YkvA (DUF1232 family)